jgi:hypothetical protein
MSQSDYIAYKRVRRELIELRDAPKNVPAVLETGKYISYKEYSLENTILSNSDRYDKLIPSNVPVVFGMVKPCASTPTFTLCRGTDQRGNRPAIVAGESYPYFRTPKIGTISKPDMLGWKTIANSTYCKCANV